MRGLWNFGKATLGVISGVALYCLLLAGVIWTIKHWRAIAETIARNL